MPSPAPRTRPTARSGPPVRTRLASGAAAALLVAGGVSALYLTLQPVASEPAAEVPSSAPATAPISAGTGVVVEYVDQNGNPIDPFPADAVSGATLQPLAPLTDPEMAVIREDKENDDDQDDDEADDRDDDGDDELAAPARGGVTDGR